MARLALTLAMALGLGISTAASAAATELPVAILPPAPETRSPAPLRVLRIHAYQAGPAIRLNGMVRREYGRPGPLPGYIRLTVRFADGREEMARCLSSRDLRAAGSRGATFSVTLAVTQPVASVAVQYRATCG